MMIFGWLRWGSRIFVSFVWAMWNPVLRISNTGRKCERPFRIHHDGIWLGIIRWLLLAAGHQVGCEQNIWKEMGIIWSFENHLIMIWVLSVVKWKLGSLNVFLPPVWVIGKIITVWATVSESEYKGKLQ